MSEDIECGLATRRSRAELLVDYGFTNVLKERFGAGIRMGEAISKDMVAVRIGPDWRLAVVGSPAYFARRAAPLTPYDLTAHDCINIPHRPAGGIYAREFEKDGKFFTVKGEGQVIYNSVIHVLDGMGLGYVPEQLAAPHISQGRPAQVLAPWCPIFDGYHLYYPKAAPTVARILCVRGGCSLPEK